MSHSKKANHRERLRAKGLRPVEVWLPTPMIERIDALKLEGEGRDTTIAKLIAGTLEGRTPPENTNQLQLAL
ncbi:antitoxin MazE-like protein [Pseudomonas sp.]|uniref:antitoxin MazE-like protein n=1 Tax=Pseudomonas sp. TaxID=306 RepID=UPI003D09C51E